MKRYKENATLGVGKIDYLIASGTKQRHIQDAFHLESFLDLTQITPMQTSYTQTAEDRDKEDDKGTPSKKSDDASKKPGIEPSGDEETSTDDGEGNE